MESLKPVFAALVVLSLTACGVETPEEQAATEAQPGELIVGTGTAGTVGGGGAQVARLPALAEPMREVRRGRAISLSGPLSAAHGTKVKMALAVIGCGFMVVGQGESTVSLNTIDVSAMQDQESYGGPEVIVFVDNDKDGACDASKGDQLLIGQVAEGATSISTTDLAAGDEWLCMMFSAPTP